ncbi:MAG: hypothetical protein AAF978_11080, partial [Cyanobacteria bacterium P01_E01_bin.48]
LNDYGQLANGVGFSDIRLADWSRQVEFFWQDVVRSALDFNVIAGIVQAGMETIRGTAAIALMTTGFDRGLIRYGILRGTKWRHQIKKKPPVCISRTGGFDVVTYSRKHLQPKGA